MTRKRIYRVWQDKANIVRVDDEVSQTLQNAARIWPSETKRALRHVAFKLQGAMKAELRSSSAGNSKLQPLSDLTKAGSLTAFKLRSRRRRKTHPGGDRGASLVQAIGYQMSKSGNSAYVGWLSPSAVRLGKIFQEGIKYKVEPKMRRMFWAAFKAGKGVFPINKDKKFINIPGRDFMTPVNDKYQPRILRLLEARIARNLGIFDDQEFNNISIAAGL